MIRNLGPLAAAAAFLAATSAPVSAQVLDDFLCSSFSYKCNQQPPLPPPALAPDVAPAPAPTPAKHVVHKHAAKHRTAAPAAKPDPAGAPASQ